MTSIQPADVANIQDQFKLIAIRSQNQDEAAGRFNNVFQAFAEEIKKSNQALSDRILVLEKEKEAAEIKGQAIAEAHLAQFKALTEQNRELSIRVNETSQRLDEANKKIALLEKKGSDFDNHVHLKGYHAVLEGRHIIDPNYNRNRPLYTEKPVII